MNFSNTADLAASLPAEAADKLHVNSAAIATMPIRSCAGWSRAAWSRGQKGKMPSNACGWRSARSSAARRQARIIPRLSPRKERSMRQSPSRRD